jgi:apolipoprotein N-acyltransferase
VFVPLLLILPELSLFRAFIAGSLYGFFANIGMMYWVYTMNYHVSHSPIASVIVLSLLSAYLAFYYGLWALAVRAVTLPSYLQIVFPAALWVALEYVHTYYLSGLPWPIVGAWQWKFLPLIQISEYTGIYGVSFLVLLINVSVVEWYRTRRWQVAAPALAIFVFVNIFGLARMQHFSGIEKPRVKVAVIQGSIAQYKKWDKAFVGEIMDTYTTLVRTAAKEAPDLLVWPETAVPGYYPHEQIMQSWVEGMVRETKTYNLVGMPFNDGGTSFYNSSVLFDPDAKILQRHNKTHLVPFGEYIPLRSILWPGLGIYNALADLTPGKNFTVFEARSMRFGTSICTENFFGDTMRRIVKNGAEFLINQTNDGWFIRTNGHQEHFIFNVFRAIENRRTILVCGNTGLSGIVNPVGQISGLLPLFENTYYVAAVTPLTELTFYTKYGDVFAQACIIVSLLLLLLWGIRKREE